MSSTVSSSAKGVTFLILIQLSSRASTFIVNQLLLRYLSPELLGIAAQLELYCISVLFFARESLRVALQRQTGGAQAVVNVAYIPLMLGVLLSYGLGHLYTNFKLSDIPHMQEAIVLCGAATTLELISEPCFAVVQQKLAYGIRATAETSATIVRCVVTFTAVAWYYQRNGQPWVFAFALGQFSYALALVTVYYAYVSTLARDGGFSLLPRRLSS